MKVSKAEKNKPSETINLGIESSQKDLIDLDERQWKVFNHILNASPTDNEKLSYLLNHKAPWE
ncbi:DUF1778 domain-containing protein [Geminocystis sp.]|uniref:type II toxin -antitoxin system TacA 1-like antitoxin n=1 Tax=Geminocystis sp. TaxID=2664100 RepID=UPI003593CCA4